MRDDYVDEDRRGERGRGRKKNKKKQVVTKDIGIRTC